jgi:adenine-specific DNA-methyltransferase
MKVISNESIGIATEKILCEIFNIKFNTLRKKQVIINETIKLDIKNAFNNIGITLTEHTGNLNKHYDFLTNDNKTISIKTNISGNKVCPQDIGQVTLKKFREKTNFTEVNDASQFKKLVFNNTYFLINLYLENLFSCDKTIYFQYSTGTVIIFEKTNNVSLDHGLFTFSQTEETWNESNTVYINDISLAEFQVHSNRDCLKCRFNINTVMRLIDSNIINGIVMEKIKLSNEYNIKTKPVFRTFNYIGSKYKLLDFLIDSITEYTGKNISELSSFGDLFTGTGIVSKHLLELGATKVISSDNQYYSSVVSSVFLDKYIDKDKVKDIIQKLNNLNESDHSDTDFIYNNYSNIRPYYTLKNGLKIDKMRKFLETIKESITIQEYNLILKSILYSASKCANITSVFGAYLKKPKASFLKNIFIEEIFVDNLINDNDKEHLIYNCDIIEAIKLSKDLEVIYLDPPYNQRNYSSNYHLLETIAKYDYPEIKGKTGLRVEETVGSKKFCCKKTIFNEFSEIISQINNKYLFISYSSEAILSKDEMIQILNKTRRNIFISEQKYKRFKSNSGISVEHEIIEYLFCSTK